MVGWCDILKVCDHRKRWELICTYRNLPFLKLSWSVHVPTVTVLLLDNTATESDTESEFSSVTVTRKHLLYARAGKARRHFVVDILRYLWCLNCSAGGTLWVELSPYWAGSHRYSWQISRKWIFTLAYFEVDSSFRLKGDWHLWRHRRFLEPLEKQPRASEILTSRSTYHNSSGFICIDVDLNTRGNCAGPKHLTCNLTCKEIDYQLWTKVGGPLELWWLNRSWSIGFLQQGKFFIVGELSLKTKKDPKHTITINPCILCDTSAWNFKSLTSLPWRERGGGGQTEPLASFWRKN